ncbi:Rap1a/Tai family immunity protein [Terricaulis sp.]|uniref:Rap1a/Tai family immunity protein n=1 Tax=Terricaulis sp. TaxID=2768686 RepID=UPI0037838841
MIIRLVWFTLASIWVASFCATAYAQNLESPMTVDTVAELRYNCIVNARVMEGRILAEDDGLRTATCGSFVVGVVNGMQIGQATAPRRLFCPAGNLTIAQEIQIFMNWANRHPEAWNDRAATGVGRAMIESFPCQ